MNEHASPPDTAMGSGTPAPGLGELLSLLGGAAGAEKGAPTLPDGLGAVLRDPQLLERLPRLMEMLKPMLAPPPPAPRPHHSPREELLIALKPFLSPERAAAVDTLVCLSRLADTQGGR